MTKRLAHQILPSSATNITVLAILSLNLTSCGTVYDESVEQFGGHKRDILINPVAQASDPQEAPKEQFSSALGEFNALLNFDSIDL